MTKLDFRSELIKLLKKGLTQQEISKELEKRGVVPNSVSSIEKELKKIRKEFGAKTHFHLGYLLGKNE